MALVRAVRLADFLGADSVDLTGIRPPFDEVERRLLDGLVAEFDVERAARAELPQTDVLVARAVALIRDRACESHLRVTDVARTLAVSASTLEHRLKARGLRFRLVMARARIDCARRLLVSSRLSVKEIAGAVGYESAAAFCARFREATGMTPTELRQHRESAMTPPSRPVLVADDDERMAGLLGALFERRGIAVLVACSADEALAVLQAYRVQAVLCPLYMAGRSGVDLLRDVRTMPEHAALPVVIHTCDLLMEYRVRAEILMLGGQLYCGIGFRREFLALADELIASDGSQTPDPRPQTPDPRPQTPDPRPQTPDPSQIQGRKHRKASATQESLTTPVRRAARQPAD